MYKGIAILFVKYFSNNEQLKKQKVAEYQFTKPVNTCFI